MMIEAYAEPGRAISVAAGEHGMQEVWGSSPLSSTMTWSDALQAWKIGPGLPADAGGRLGVSPSLSLAAGPA